MCAQCAGVQFFCVFRFHYVFCFIVFKSNRFDLCGEISHCLSVNSVYCLNTSFHCMDYSLTFFSLHLGLNCYYYKKQCAADYNYFVNKSISIVFATSFSNRVNSLFLVLSLSVSLRMVCSNFWHVCAKIDDFFACVHVYNIFQLNAFLAIRRFFAFFAVLLFSSAVLSQSIMTTIWAQSALFSVHATIGKKGSCEIFM